MKFLIFLYCLFIHSGKADSKLAAWVSLHTVFCMLQSQQWQEAKDLAKQVQIKLLIHYCECRSNLARASNTFFFSPSV